MFKVMTRLLTGAAVTVVAMLCLLGAGIGAARAAPITEFSAGVGTAPGSLTVGPDGNLWFVDQGSIGRITPTGQVTQFTHGLNPGAAPSTIATGGNGDLWFTDNGTTDAIGEITPAGQITEFDAGNSWLNTDAVPSELTEGPDGSQWFLDDGSPTRAIGEISKTGVITEHTYSMDVNDNLNAITEGPDGNMYFTVQNVNKAGVGKVDVATGTVSETISGVMPNDITAAPDGNVWFTDQGGGTVSRLTASADPASTGTVTTFGTAAGIQPNATPDGGLTAGPGGDVWFDDTYSGNDAVGRVTPAGQITEFPLSDTPLDITPGIDGNVWIVLAHAVLRVTPLGAITPITAGLNPGSEFMDGTNIISGPDGNLWTIDGGTPKAIVRVDVQLPPVVTTGAASSITSAGASIAGTVNSRGAGTTASIQYGTTPSLGSSTPAGALPAADVDTPVTAGLSSLTAGRLYYYRVEATNAYGTVDGAIASFTTGPAPATTSTPTSTTAAGTRTLTARVGNQSVTLVTAAPNVCVAPSKSLTVTLSSAAINDSKATELQFRSAAFYLDRGVKHSKTVRKRIGSGGFKKVKVVAYRANATERHLPVRVALPLNGLARGTHTLKITVAYTEHVTRHHHHLTVKVIKTLHSSFRIC